ncbi:MAG: type II/IV secretion system protein [Chloroflexi bacterium]|nr:type II/IV secretion system protein [Chloroflexota bacterium]
MINVPLDRPRIKLRRSMPQPAALQLIPEAMARKYMAVPLEVAGSTLRVALVNPADFFALEALAAQSQMRIEPEMASREEIQEAIDFNYKAYDEIEKQISNIALPGLVDEQKPDASHNAPVVRALRLMIDEAAKARASDIHVEPQDDGLRVRFRIDGTLRNALSLPAVAATPLISRIKILSNMNIADHHRAQDGRFSLETNGKVIDIRVGVAPTVFGEMAVLRLLEKSGGALSLTQLGFLPESLEKYEKMLSCPYGMILVSGPTGAGKTTTLYASLNCLDHTERNIITIEDPVEYHSRNINQIQVNPKAGITFPSGLRSILRLDPDIILVGEIRDAETSSIAVQAALTGHLMLSSIHANDAVGVIFRLLDLGVEPLLVSSTLIGVVAQRMVRRVCSECARPVRVPFVEKLAYSREIGEDRDEFLYGAGCKSCVQTGYRGRTGLFEILQLNDELRAMLLAGASAPDLRARAIKDGMVTLARDGMLKVKAGLTTPSEILRNAYTVE